MRWVRTVCGCASPPTSTSRCPGRTSTRWAVVGVPRKDGEPALIVDDDGSATLHVRVGDETNLEIVLERDLTVRTTRGPAVVRRIALYADDPQAYLEEVRRHIG